MEDKILILHINPRDCSARDCVTYNNTLSVGDLKNLINDLDDTTKICVCVSGYNFAAVSPDDVETI